MAPLQCMQRLDTWRASKTYVVTTLTFTGFVHNFASSFVVPVLPYILESRIGLEGDQIQHSISIILSLFGLTMSLLSPFVGVFIDTFPNRKGPLVLGLIAQLASIGLIALSTGLPLLYLSSILQGVAGALLNITALSTLADIAGSSNMGKTLGISGPMMKSGSLTGPMVAGLLLSNVGYWRAWTVPIAVIILDLLLRITVIERPRTSSEPPILAALPSDDTPTIETPLLPEISSNGSELSSIQPLSSTKYFTCIIKQRRVISSIFLTIVFAIASSSFNATLPLHAQTTFRWGPREVGLLFLALLGPSVMLSPFAGWLRDAVGIRWPAMAGTFLAIPSFVLIGLAGDERISWLRGDHGKAILVGALLLAGFAIELTAGTAIIEGTLVIDELDARSPGIFGPRGGYSRYFSLTTMLVPIGWLLGPLVSGALNVRFGYAVMNDVMAALALICFMTATLWIGPR